jgi:diadenylate cyclase
VPVIAVSHSMRTITLYLDGWRQVLEAVGSVLSRATQAVATLEHYRVRFDEAAGALDGLELQGRVTLRDVLILLGRAELVHRLAGELEQHVAELGADGRLLRLQLDEQSAGVDEAELLAVRDYLRPRPGWEAAEVLAELGRLTPEELLDMASMGKALDLTGDQEALDTVVAPRGYRLLARVPQLPPEVVERVVERFGSLKVILAVGVEDLEEAEGVGAGGARQLREGLKRLAEGGKPEGDG